MNLGRDLVLRIIVTLFRGGETWDLRKLAFEFYKKDLGILPSGWRHFG